MAYYHPLQEQSIIPCLHTKKDCAFQASGAAAAGRRRTKNGKEKGLAFELWTKCHLLSSFSWNANVLKKTTL